MIFKQYSREQTAGSSQSSRTGDFGRTIISLFQMYRITIERPKTASERAASEAYNHQSEPNQKGGKDAKRTYTTRSIAQ
jgi:hypothetical protein